MLIDITEKTMESFLTRTVKSALLSHLHPRTAIALTIQEMQSDGLVSILFIEVEIED